MNNYRRFVLSTFLFAVPFIIILISYFILDPFKALYHYDNYYPKIERGPELNKDMVTTSYFLQQQDSMNFNSFILGNSRSFAFETKEWQKHLSQDAVCFHFSAYGESLYGVSKKVSFLYKKATLKNVLIVWDSDLLAMDYPEYSRVLHMVTPSIDNGSWYKWHKCFLTGYLTPKMCSSFLLTKILGRVTPLTENVIGIRAANYEDRFGNLTYQNMEKKIKDGIYYTPELIKLFQERDSVDITVAHYKPQVITTENHKNLLYEIKKAFESSNTAYKIVISPMWDAQHINPSDKKILEDIFGKEYIYDYSGYNSYTQDWHNYYERMHYRVGVANDIMNKIY